MLVRGACLNYRRKHTFSEKGPVTLQGVLKNVHIQEPDCWVHHVGRNGQGGGIELVVRFVLGVPPLAHSPRPLAEEYCVHSFLFHKNGQVDEL